MQRSFAVLYFLIVSTCPATPAEVSDAARYVAAIEQWQTERVERLKSKEGYLNLAGLYWLKEGPNTFGSDATNDMVFPAGKAAPRIGTLTLREGRVTMAVEPGVRVLLDGEEVSEAVLESDEDENTSVLLHKNLSWFIIERGSRMGLRLRDFDHPALAAFGGIESYPVDPSWRVDALLRPYDEPRRLNVPTVVDGLEWDPVSPGVLEFRLQDTQLTLEATLSGERLLIIFADRTSGRETYGAGRFVYVNMPDATGATVIDFNKAYNPPCAFNDFATCPVAPSRNRLPVAIRAGEKYDPGLHYGEVH